MYDFLLIYVASDIVGNNVRGITAYLNKNGINTKLLFLAKEYWETLEDGELSSIVDFARETRLIGVSLFSNYLSLSRCVTGHLRKELETPILWGGVHPTLRPKECAGIADAVCVGEGENALLELFVTNKWANKFSIHHPIAGLCWKEDCNFIEHGFGSILENLNDIPGQDLFSDKAFVLINGQVTPLEREYITTSAYFINGRVSLLASRGCPFSCTFCNNSFLNENSNKPKVRRQSVDHVIDQITSNIREWPEIKLVRFNDDAFISLPKMWMEQFCENYKRDIGLPLDVAGVNPIQLSEEKLSLLVDVGLKTLRMGIQTGSEKARLAYKRKETNKILIEKFAILSRYDIKVRLDFILDNPFETDEERIESLRFINLIPLRKVQLNFYSLTFLPGTKLYDRAVLEGIITDEERYLSQTDTKQPAKSYINALNYYLGMRCRPKIWLDILLSGFVRNSPLTMILRKYFIWRYPFAEPRYSAFSSKYHKG